MFICLCKSITDGQIKDCVASGANNLKDVRRSLGVATQCCKCVPDAHAVIDEALLMREQQHIASTQTAVANSSLFYSA